MKEMLKQYWMVFAVIAVVLLVGAFEAGKGVRSYEIKLRHVADCVRLKQSIERQEVHEIGKLQPRLESNTSAIIALIRSDTFTVKYTDLEVERTKLYQEYGFIRGYAQGVMEQCKERK